MASPKAANAVPSITDLRKMLDYGDSALARCQTFIHEVRIFRGKFISSQGLEGKDLINWKSDDHQQALEEMIDAYLDRDGNGIYYWPNDPTSSRYNQWQYLEHRSHIRKYLKQLFFRLGLHQHRNLAYKAKRGSDKSDASRARRGGSKDNPIDLNSVDDDMPVEKPSSVPITPAVVNRETMASIRPQISDTKSVDPAFITEPRNINPHNGSNRDPYSVPQSPPPIDSIHIHTHSHITSINSPAAEVDSVQQPIRSTIEGVQPFRRIKVIRRTPPQGPSGDQINEVKEKRKRGKRKWPETERTLRSSRQRRTIYNPEQATESELDAVCASPMSVDTCSGVASNAGRVSSMSEDNTRPMPSVPEDSAMPVRLMSEDSARPVTSKSEGIAKQATSMSDDNVSLASAFKPSSISGNEHALFNAMLRSVSQQDSPAPFAEMATSPFPVPTPTAASVRSWARAETASERATEVRDEPPVTPHWTPRHRESTFSDIMMPTIAETASTTEQANQQEPPPPTVTPHWSPRHRESTFSDIMMSTTAEAVETTEQANQPEQPLPPITPQWPHNHRESTSSVPATVETASTTEQVNQQEPQPPPLMTTPHWSPKHRESTSSDIVVPVTVETASTTEQVNQQEPPPRRSVITLQGSPRHRESTSSDVMVPVIVESTSTTEHVNQQEPQPPPPITPHWPHKHRESTSSDVMVPVTVETTSTTEQVNQQEPQPPPPITPHWPHKHRESISSDIMVPTTTETASTTEQVNQQKLPVPLPPPRPRASKPQVVFSYRVIHSRHPSEVVRSWVPKGRFKEKTLSELEQEIPMKLPAEAKGWLFTLSGPGVDVVIEARRGREDEYKDMTEYLDRMIKRALTKNDGQDRLSFVIEIEALMDEAYTMRKVEAYEETVEW